MLHVIKLSVKAKYTTVMVKSLTMLGTTGKVHYVTYQFAWLVATQIASASPLVHRILQ